jgi:hypothetical protein
MHARKWNRAWVVFDDGQMLAFCLESFCERQFGYVIFWRNTSHLAVIKPYVESSKRIEKVTN